MMFKGSSQYEWIYTTDAFVVTHYDTLRKTPQVFFLKFLSHEEVNDL